MVFEIRSFLGTHERFYLIAARASTLEPLTDSPDLLGVLEQGYVSLMKGLEGTLLQPYAQAENAAVLYHGWMAEGARADFEQGGTRLSSRHAPEHVDLGNLLDEVSLTHELLGDSILWARTLRDEGGAKADSEEFRLLGLNLELVERKEDHLADPRVMYQIRELRTLIDGLRGAAGGADPVGIGRAQVCRIVGSVFLAYTLYRTFQSALDDLTVFAFRTGTLKLRPPFADPATDGLLAASSVEPEFLKENLDALARAHAAFREAASRLAADHFSDASWTAEGELQPLPLLLAQLWDDRGLLGRVAAGDIGRLCRGEGPLFAQAEESMAQAGRGVRGLIAIRRLTELAAEVDAALDGVGAAALDEMPPGPLLDRVAACEKAVKEREQALVATSRRLREEVSMMNIDHSGLLDPAIEHLILLLPPGSTMTSELARNLLFFSRRAGALYEPIQAKLEEVKRHCRYLRELHMFQEGQLLECQRYIEEGDLATAKTFFAELEWVFDDLDYASVAAPLGLGPKPPAA